MTPIRIKYIFFKIPTVLKKFFIFWFPVLIYCLLIFIQSSCPTCESIPRIPYLDKVFHFIGYAVLGALFFRVFNRIKFLKSKNMIMILAMLTACLYGISDELHQYFVPCRDASLMDLYADMAGSVCGVFFYQALVAKCCDNLLYNSWIDKIDDFL